MEGSLVENNAAQEDADFELLRDKLEYFEVKSDFFENQTEEWGKLIHEQEAKDYESLQEQELIDLINEREEEKKKLITYLESLKSQNIMKNKTEAMIKKNLVDEDGFFNCPECPKKFSLKPNLKIHIEGIHRKLKPWNCLSCDKSWCFII